MAQSILAQMKAAICKNSSHQWGEWKLNDAVCTSTRICRRCNEEETNQAEHQWTDWNYGMNSCAQSRSCIHCGVKEERKVEHEWGEVFLNKNCRDAKKCGRCGKEIELTVAMHEWGEWQNTKEYNCGNGQIVRECKQCHQIEISQNSHTWGDWKSVENKCVQVRTCIICGEKTEKAIEHNWGDWRHIVERCVDERECQVCKNKQSKDHHTLGEWFESEKCHRTRKCEFCAETESIVKHTWGELIYDGQCNSFVICKLCGIQESRGVHHDYRVIKVRTSSVKMGAGDDYWEYKHTDSECARCGKLSTMTEDNSA